MSKILKNGGLDQYDPERFGRLILLQSEKCGTERFKRVCWLTACLQDSIVFVRVGGVNKPLLCTNDSIVTVHVGLLSFGACYAYIDYTVNSRGD